MRTDFVADRIQVADRVAQQDGAAPVEHLEVDLIGSWMVNAAELGTFTHGPLQLGADIPLICVIFFLITSFFKGLACFLH
jgi:hypothetical protein